MKRFIFSEYIKDLRLKKNMSLRKVKKLTGLSENYLNRLENKLERHPELNILDKISSAYDTTIYQIMKYREETKYRSEF